MRRYIFTCHTCGTKMLIETELPDDKIHKVPPCPCGISRMMDIESKQHIEEESYKLVKETNLGLEEIENPDACLCLDCLVSKDGL